MILQHQSSIPSHYFNHNPSSPLLSIVSLVHYLVSQKFLSSCDTQSLTQDNPLRHRNGRPHCRSIFFRPKCPVNKPYDFRPFDKAEPLNVIA
jgi:hypothetical protein